jgi:hypothetical protein
MDLAGSTVVLQGGGQMEAGSELCKEQDDEKPLLVFCQLIEICQFDYKVHQFFQGEQNGSMRTEYNWGV